jgi:hypothetical protein
VPLQYPKTHYPALGIAVNSLRKKTANVAGSGFFGRL